MTDDQFNTWTADLFAKFPAIRTWVANLHDGGELLAAWRDALVAADLDDCLEVNRRFIAGDDDGPGKFPSDWQALPASVRRFADSVRLRRESISHRFSDEPAFSEPRYRCADCRDSGRMLVAHPAMVSAWFAGALDQCRYRTASVLCCCQISEPIRTLQKREPLARTTASYNSQIHYAIDWSDVHRWSFPLDAERLNRFAAWCEEQHQAWLASRRFGEFDSFNRGEAFA